MRPDITRRQLLALVAAAGGSTAVYQTSRAMGLLPDASPMRQLDLKQVDASKHVVILGAGIAGLTAAYELERAGYRVTVIEASHRVGGRNLTVRSGDVIDELGQKQVCEFDDHPDLYFNTGPARIPGHHRRVLKYCRELRVPLIVKANFARNAYHQDDEHFGGQPVRMGQYVADARGFLSELLYKAVDQNQMNQPLSAEDRERLMQFVAAFGDLGADGRYGGSRRAGYEGGFMRPEIENAPLPFAELLSSDFWQTAFFVSENPDWGDPLMEVAGGMDNIVKAFAREISAPITLQAPVQSISLTENGVDVIYQHAGKRHKVSADYCLNSVPTHFMPGIANNLPRDYQAALAALRPGNFMKIGLQMKTRFWEDEGIYGGVTFSRQPINAIWYPSHDIHSRKGIVLGAYTVFEKTDAWQQMTPAERIELAARCGDKIHKGYSSNIETGVSVPWGRMNHMMGCSVRWTDEQRAAYFDLLRQPAAGRHYMIGDQVSYHPTWQEGAFASAEYALRDLDARVRAETASAEG